MKVEDVHDRIRSLAYERGLSIYELARTAGIAESTLYNIFERGTMPKLDTVDRLCEALDITMSDFFLFTSNPGEGRYISDEEIQLLEMNRVLTRRNKEHLMVYAKAMVDAQEPVKTDSNRMPKKNKV